MTTLAQAQAMLAEYLAAESALLQGKEIRLSSSGGGGGDRTWRSEDLSELRRGRMEWEKRVALLQANQAGAPTFGGVRFSHANFGD